MSFPLSCYTNLVNTFPCVIYIYIQTYILMREMARRDSELHRTRTKAYEINITLMK